MNNKITNKRAQKSTIAQYLTQSSFAVVRWCFLLGWLWFVSSSPAASAQSTDRSVKSDSLKSYQLQTVVVTALKSPSVLEDTPIPIRVLGREQIRQRGALRLSDLLAEEPGLMLTHFLGTGIQMQGLDPDYTLILLDGQPLVGRSGGTLDLDRLSVSDIASVEIVQGPSSSLYGSDALAGVINLRSREAERPFGVDAGVRYQTHNTSNVNVSLEGRASKTGWRLSLDRFASDGYDLNPDLPGQTGPAFVKQTVSSRWTSSLHDAVDINLSARFAHENLDSDQSIVLNGIASAFQEQQRQTDWSVAPEMKWRIQPGHSLTLKGYTTGFRTQSSVSIPDAESDSDFRQSLGRVEVQHDLVAGSFFILTSGAGLSRETVSADRIAGGHRSNQTAHAFSQQQFLLSESVHLVTSFRADHHTEYGWHMSPNAAVMFSAKNTMRFRLSAGTGFKAPSFQQLYMDFTNAVAGYSVIGSADAQSNLKRLEENGLITRYLGNPSLLQTVGPETAVSYQASFDSDLGKRVHLHVALFHNRIGDMIETLPVAQKTNGQQVFSYLNLNRISSRGMSFETRFRPSDLISIQAGYQFVQARDLDVLDQIAAGTLYGRRDGVDYLLKRSDYGGLFNRSKHSGTLQLAVSTPQGTTDVRLRATARSRYGFGDQNGNLVLDASNEYVPAQMLWNLTINRKLTSLANLQVGVINLFDRMNAERIPSLSGRQVFASVLFSSE